MIKAFLLETNKINVAGCPLNLRSGFPCLTKKMTKSLTFRLEKKIENP